jgi:hypothetical protein
MILPQSNVDNIRNERKNSLKLSTSAPSARSAVRFFVKECVSPEYI